MSGQKASRLKFLWIATQTGLITFYYCCRIIFGSKFVRELRPFVDRMMRLWAEKLLKLIAVKINVTGQSNFPNDTSRPVIVMCNHSSLYDIPTSIVALNTSLRMLAKKELFKIPVFSAALRRGEFLSIDRHNREQSLKDLEVAKAKMLSGIILWVAPEGTRSKDGKLAEFKKGGFHIALDTKALVIPLVIKNIHKVQAGSDLQLFLNQQIDVEICQPIDAAEFNVETRREFVALVRERMLTALQQNCAN
ncbi:lysophospholipid acyltransferase family protein [Aliikangiella maris]|uniref:Lysophospholipid acyltransferase family protein n=2 Tax=Aliikangiella maris TaxID=3162458 RepID=A0ABV3MRE9_9GAMM